MSSSRAKLRQIEKRLDELEETMEILADKKLLAALRKSLDDIKEGRYKDYQSVKEFRSEFESKA
jgi:DNA topoisomerase IA